MNTAVIFDCDGTLARSLDLGMGSYDYALEKIGAAPRAPDDIKQYFGASADRIFLKLLGDEELALRAFEHYFDHQSQEIHKVQLHEGIIELLENLKEAHVPMGVVTGRHERDLELILGKHRLHGYFKTLVCDNHLPHSKPAPDGILLAAKNLGVDVKRSYYAGDSTMDLLAANAAGAKGIAALWDRWSKEDEMKQHDPALLARTPRQIWDYLKTV